MTEAGKLGFALGAPGPNRDLEHRMKDTSPGQIVETCAPALPIISEIAHRVGSFGGAAIVIDYGNTQSLGDTFQALENHKPCNPFERPGMADLTAHVDFGALGRAAKEIPFVTVSPLTPQGVFLESLGITNRAQALAKTISGQALENHIAAHRRLTHPEEM